MQEVLNGEGIIKARRGNQAPPSQRRVRLLEAMLADLIDFGISATLVVALIIPFGVAGLIAGLLIIAGLATLLEGGPRGATVGESLLGVRAVRNDDRTQLGHARALGRLLGRCVSALALFVGYFGALLDSDRRTWHDRVTGAVLEPSRERTERSPRWLPAVPALVLAWAALIGVLALNTSMVDGQTKPARADIGTLVSTPWGAMQVRVDGPANAPVIVLLHGWSTSLHWWDRVTSLLDGRFRVIRIDEMGFGGSAKPASGYSIPDQARDIDYVLRRLGVHDATVVGHSMGGAISVGLAQADRALVRRVAIVDMRSSGNFGRPLPTLLALTHVPVVGELLSRIATDSAIRSGAQVGFAPGYHPSEVFARQIVHDYRAATFTALHDAFDLTHEFQTTKPLAQRLRPLGLPLLVVFGTQDQFFYARSAANEYRSVPGAQIVMLPRTGHSPNVEKPYALAQLIAGFAGAR